MTVTRNDVARLAGVSPAVVSYVLNDGPRPVSAAARVRVLAAVETLGYTPDARARSLRLGNTNTLGLVVPDATNPFFAELAGAVENAAYSHRYALLVCSSADESTREAAYVRSLSQRRIDGLILVSSRVDQDLSGMTDLSIPVIAVDRSPDESPVSTIRADTRAAAFEATRHLIEHGHSVVDFVGGPPLGVTEERRSGWRDAVRHAGISGQGWQSSFTYQGGAELGSRITTRAVVVASDVQAVGMLAALHARQLRAPADVAIVSIDGTAASQYAVPPLTAVAQPIHEMGRMAVEHLIDPAQPTVHLSLANELVVRSSCGCGAPV